MGTVCIPSTNALRIIIPQYRIVSLRRRRGLLARVHRVRDARAGRFLRAVHDEPYNLKVWTLVRPRPTGPLAPDSFLKTHPVCALAAARLGNARDDSQQQLRVRVDEGAGLAVAAPCSREVLGTVNTARLTNPEAVEGDEARLFRAEQRLIRVEPVGAVQEGRKVGR